MKLLDIGEVSAASGLPPSTLRYYDEIGLITSLGRHGLRRQFGPQVLMQLALIGLGRAAGFALPEIAAMFGRDGRPDLPRDDLRKRADMLDRQIAELAALRGMLRHIADCPAPSHLECASFRKLLTESLRRGRPPELARRRALTVP
jgi:DNA-binding transcriptional MerR regulator